MLSFLPDKQAGTLTNQNFGLPFPQLYPLHDHAIHNTSSAVLANFSTFGGWCHKTWCWGCWSALELDQLLLDHRNIIWVHHLPPSLTPFNILFYFEAFLDNFQLVGVFTWNITVVTKWSRINKSKSTIFPSIYRDFCCDLSRHHLLVERRSLQNLQFVHMLLEISLHRICSPAIGDSLVWVFVMFNEFSWTVVENCLSDCDIPIVWYGRDQLVLLYTCRLIWPRMSTL